ncbi:unnamed protein product [Gordionus sp. m RMFG-2023]|uniref:WD and tetratricopeptide repeats protein 1-like isoform X2 n=1 Tax=Gordionus sp. m RMFG-2023 TaxID=3053472 RepID=UPI0030DE022D
MVKHKSNYNIFYDIDQRNNFGEKTHLHFQRKNHVKSQFIQRLTLKQELQGHNGCVNCLEWNTKGNLLVSGSDDFKIILWDPYSSHSNNTKNRSNILHTIQTHHYGNIFSVKFLPETNDSIIVSGAADKRVCLHDINYFAKVVNNGYNGGKQLVTCHYCHRGRVKRIGVTDREPFMIWSIGEDGLVMQYDTRMPACPHHNASTTHDAPIENYIECNNILLNLNLYCDSNSNGKSSLNIRKNGVLEGKCMAINPLRPEMLAVGCNDPYVRVFDRRFLTATTFEAPAGYTSQDAPSYSERNGENVPLNACRYFVPGHVPFRLKEYKKKFRNLACTYTTFSPDGSELLVNLGGEQIYLYDTLFCYKPKNYSLKRELIQSYDDNHMSSLYSSPDNYSNKIYGYDDQISLATALSLASEFKMADRKHEIKPESSETNYETIPKKQRKENGFSIYTSPSCNISQLPSNKNGAFPANNLIPSGSHIKRSFKATLADLLGLDNDHDGHVVFADINKILSNPFSLLPPSADTDPLVLKLKEEANQYFRASRFDRAITSYNKALSKINTSVSIYTGPASSALLSCNRAASLIKRNWDGDNYAAMLDCFQALRLEPLNIKARFRFIKCLMELDLVKESRMCLERFKKLFPINNYARGDDNEKVENEGDISGHYRAVASAFRILESHIAAKEFHVNDQKLKSDKNGVAKKSKKEPPKISIESDRPSSLAASSNPRFKDRAWKKYARDYKLRYCGHCNTTTDIKEANFFGSEGQFIVAGSDDGYYFVWDKASTNICKVLVGDEAIVNCLQPNPVECLLATSGIDPHIRLWSPGPEISDNYNSVAYEVENAKNNEETAASNQKRMNADPIEVMLMNMGYRVNPPSASNLNPLPADSNFNSSLGIFEDFNYEGHHEGVSQENFGEVEENDNDREGSEDTFSTTTVQCRTT